MNVREFSLLVKKEYKSKNGERFFSERALLSALLQKAGLDRNLPLTDPLFSLEREGEMKKGLEALLSGYPLQYYLGTEFFCGLEFDVAEGVLIPRPETQLLVSLACQKAKEGAKIFDFCCGSGCIGISLSVARPDLSLHLFDLSDDALALARKNREKLCPQGKIDIQKADLLSCQAEACIRRFSPDLIVSNPPYLTKKEMGEIEKNVANEPSMALFGGEDGLSFYRAFLSLAARFEIPLLCEIGCAQKKELIPLLETARFSYEFYSDEAGLDRAFYAEKQNDKK